MASETANVRLKELAYKASAEPTNTIASQYMRYH
jgi:hypothetical protein